MTIYDALERAVEVLENESMMYRPDYRLQAKRVDDAWAFWFVFLPETPGLDVTVTVHDDGSHETLVGI